MSIPEAILEEPIQEEPAHEEEREAPMSSEAEARLSLLLLCNKMQVDLMKRYIAKFNLEHEKGAVEWSDAYSVKFRKLMNDSELGLRDFYRADPKKALDLIEQKLSEATREI